MRRFAVEDETPVSPTSATNQSHGCNYGLDRRSEVFERLVMHAAGVYQLFVPLTSDLTGPSYLVAAQARKVLIFAFALPL